MAEAMEGVTVKLPVTPYECQEQMMKEIILGCQDAKHCLLESPAGSGKTLALLCGALAWQRANANERVKIYYATRTHGQIQQVVEELRRTIYTDTKMAVLGSRDRTCVNETIEGNKDEGCHNLRRTEAGCNFYSNKAEINTHHALKCKGINQSWDIEDLVELGKNHKACPYYAAMDLAVKADIIFCPYNYLLDPRIRESLPEMDRDMNGAIVIFDDGHNLDDCCRAAGSINITKRQLLNVMIEPSIDPNVREYCNRFLRFINGNPNLMGQELMDKMNQLDLLTDHPSLDEFVYPEQLTDSFATERLVKTLKFARKMIREHGLDYGAIVEDYNTPNRELKLLCLSPAVIFKRVAETSRNVIVASSNIYSMGKFSNELNTTFTMNTFANNNRLFVRTILNGSNSGVLNAATWELTKLSDNEQKLLVGLTILDICWNVPYGILCFFPSYEVMKFVIKAWKIPFQNKINGLNTTIWDEISRYKTIHVENNETNVRDLMVAFQSSIPETSTQMSSSSRSSQEFEKGALLLAVHRGKFSEGIRFPNNLARAIVSVGLPLAKRDNIEIDMKYRYNDLKHANNDLFSNGEEWYRINAFNALNTSFGRCMGEKNDWGSILLLNQTMLRVRLSDESYQQYLPSWVRSKAEIASNYDHFRGELRGFCTTQLQQDRNN